MIKNLNYKNLGTVATHIVRGTPRKYDETGVTETILQNAQPLEQVDLKKDPNNSSDTVHSISIGDTVTMLREWVTGSETWAYVRYGDLVGYIPTQHLQIASAYVDLVLPKAEITIQPLTALGLALSSTDNWMENESPYYHSGNGEWWFTVILPYTCIENGTLEEKKKEAREAAVSYMYEYFGLNVSDKIPDQSKFLDGLQSTYAKDYYLSTRPGSKLAMLVTIPAIYVEYLKQNNVAEEINPELIDDDYCITLAANTLDDLDQAAANVTECLTRVYQKYLNSNLKVLDFDFPNEIVKQNTGIYWIKFLIKENGIVLDSTQNQSAAPDACTSSPNYRKIEVCFSNDDEYNLLAVNYYNNFGEKKALTNGLSLVKNSFPFNEPRFGNLFLNQHVLCNLPEPPPPQTFFEEYCIDPVPEYTISTIKTDENEKKLSPALKKLTPYASEELNVFISTTLFLASLSQQYGNILDRDQAGGGGLGYNCYNSSKAVDAFKLKIIESRDSQFMYAGDIMNAIDWLCQPGLFDDFPSMDAVLGGGKGKTDGKGDDEDDDWGFGWLLGDWDDWKAVFNLQFGDWKMPSWNPIAAIGEAALGAWKELKDQIYMNIIRLFLDAKCRTLLASAVAAGAIGVGLGIGLSAYYKNQNKKNKLGGTTPALPTPAEIISKDYGAENCNDIIQESLGSNNSEDYNKNLLQIFQRCGVGLSDGQENIPQQYLDGISTVTSPVELLALLEGSTSVALVNFIFSYTKENFPVITESKNTPSKLSGLFVCLGENTTDSAIENVQNKIEEKIKDIDYCEQLAQKLADIMKEKCPNPEVFESAYSKEVGSNIEKYQEIITLIEDECNNIQINLYNNNETGEKGILSVLNGKMKGEQKLHDNLGESLVGAAKASANFEINTLISGEEYEEYFNQVIYGFEGGMYGQGLPIRGFPEKGFGTQSRYRHLYTGQGEQDFIAPIYYLGGSTNGNIEVRAVENIDSVIEEGVRIQVEKPPLGSNVQSIIQNNENYDYSENILGLSDNQIIFHSLINNFFEENSKNYMGNNLTNPVPYGITPYLLDLTPQDHEVLSENDRFFSTIFESFAKKYANMVGSQWSGDDQSDALQAYSQAIIDNFEKILDYSESKKEITKYFDAADYDNPNDSSTINPKQFSMMNGLLHSYTRHHLLEFFASTMPFYEVFNFDNSSSGIDQTPIDLYPDVIVNYVAQKIEQEIITKFQNQTTVEYYLNFINKTYDFVSMKLSYQTKQYDGPRRGLEFYVDTNTKSVYKAFTDALKQVPSQFKKPSLIL